MTSCSSSFKTLFSFRLNCHFLCEWSRINKGGKPKRQSDRERKTGYVCVLGKLLRGGWGLWKATLLVSRPVSIKGMIQVSLSLSLHTHLHTVPLNSLKTPKNMVYCSPSQPKNTIWNWRVNSEWGRRAHSNTVQCVCEKSGISFPLTSTSLKYPPWLQQIIHEWYVVSGNVRELVFFLFKFPLAVTSHQLCTATNGCVWVCKWYCSQNSFHSVQTAGLIESFNYTRQNALYWWLLCECACLWMSIIV